MDKKNKLQRDFFMFTLCILQCVGLVIGCVVATVFSWQNMGAWCLFALMIPYSITISTICDVVKRIKEENERLKEKVAKIPQHNFNYLEVEKRIDETLKEFVE